MLNHVITVADFLRTLGGIAGVLAALIGLLMMFAGMMSDDPESGNRYGGIGCALIIGGLAFAVALGLGWIL
jgi:hypothetical protein